MASPNQEMILAFWQETKPEQVQTMRRDQTLAQALQEAEMEFLERLEIAQERLEAMQPIPANATYQERLEAESQIQQAAREVVQQDYLTPPKPEVNTAD